MVARAVTVPPRSPVCFPQAPFPQRHPVEDFCCITTTFHYLHISGWYWGALSASEAQNALLAQSEGTFLVRDSSHPQYMLTLSVKTCFGPTSVRIKYSGGSFWLDSASPEQLHCRLFPSVLSLIQYYTNDKTPDRVNQDPTKINADSIQTTTHDGGVPLKLKRPLLRPSTLPSLQHLTRLIINRHTNCPDLLPLPAPLLHYLNDYPFHI